MGKKMARLAKAAQNYEDRPPRCNNCTYYLKAHVGRTSAESHPDLCNRGKFVVNRYGVCDVWQGTRGERLDYVPQQTGCLQ